MLTQPFKIIQTRLQQINKTKYQQFKDIKTQNSTISIIHYIISVFSIQIVIFSVC